MKQQPAVFITIGSLLLLIPFMIHGMSSQIISWMAPGDLVPQAAMVYYGLIWLASWLVFPPISITLIVIGILRLRKIHKSHQER